MPRLSKDDRGRLAELGYTVRGARELLRDACADASAFERRHPDVARRAQVDFARATWTSQGILDPRLYNTPPEEVDVAAAELVLGRSHAERARALTAEIRAALAAFERAEAEGDAEAADEAMAAADVLSEALFDLYEALVEEGGEEQREGGEEEREGFEPELHEELALAYARHVGGRYSDQTDFADVVRHVLKAHGFDLARITDDEAMRAAREEFERRRDLLVRLRRGAQRREVSEAARVMHALAVVQAGRIPPDLREKLGCEALEPLRPNRSGRFLGLLRSGLEPWQAYAVIRG